MKNVKLIALDMDGTLLASDHWTVPQRNIEAIQKAHTAGIRVCICTGRMLADASDFCRRLSLPCMLIACNGTRAADGLLPEGHVFYRKTFSPEDAQAALDILLPSGLMINVFEDELVSTRQSEAKEEYHLVKRGLMSALYGEDKVRAAADRGIMKIFTVDVTGDGDRLRKLADAIRTKLPHLEVTSSGAHNIEIMPPQAGKGAALDVMARYLGLSRENVMAMGDANNDLSMLSYAVHSVAMGNATDEVKRACRYVTGTNDECGVAQMIERVLEQQK